MTDRKIGIGLLIIVSVLFVETFSFPMRPHITLNTDFWPRVLLALTAALACFLIWKGNLDGVVVERMKSRAFFVVGFCILYVLLLDFFGFLILTPIFIFLGSVALSKQRTQRRYIESSVMAIVGTIATFLVFQKGLLVQLPEGFLH